MLHVSHCNTIVPAVDHHLLLSETASGNDVSFFPFNSSCLTTPLSPSLSSVDDFWQWISNFPAFYRLDNHHRNHVGTRHHNHDGHPLSPIIATTSNSRRRNLWARDRGCEWEKKEIVECRDGELQSSSTRVKEEGVSWKFGGRQGVAATKIWWVGCQIWVWNLIDFCFIFHIYFLLSLCSWSLNSLNH